MNWEQQIKLQAFLDGELPDAEAREILAWTQRDPGAAALLAELKNVRQAMAKAEPYLTLPESREFYWSKIEREIDRLEPRPAVAPTSSFFSNLRRLLMPVGAVAALVLACVIAWPHFRSPLSKSAADASEVVTTLADADAVTYRDEQEDTTLVWLSYPASVASAKGKPAHT